MNDQELNRLTEDEILERLPAFVVGALNPDEMLEVEEYLHTHPEMMKRVYELELAAPRLAYAAPAQPLPKDSYNKIMSRARASLPPQPAPTPAQASAGRARPQAQPQENWLSAWWRRRGPWDLGLAAAVAGVLILGIVYLGALGQINTLQRQVQGLESQLAIIQVQNEELQNTNTRLQSELDASQNQLAAITGAEQTVALGGTEAAPDASATLYVQGDTGTLVMRNIDQLGDDQVYQLWLIPAEGAPIPAGLLGQASEGGETITLALPSDLNNIAAIGVSVEPPGGSAAPTGPIVLLGETA